MLAFIDIIRFKLKAKKVCIARNTIRIITVCHPVPDTEIADYPFYKPSNLIEFSRIGSEKNGKSKLNLSARGCTCYISVRKFIYFYDH